MFVQHIPGKRQHWVAVDGLTSLHRATSQVVLLLYLCVLQEELKSLMAIADVDGDGLIDYNEFVAATMHVSKLEKEELLQKVG
jgi:hypothetical protein